MNVRTTFAAVAAMTFLSVTARAEPLRAREGASLQAPGAWSVGLIEPTRIGLTKNLELAGQPFAWLLLSPNAELRVGLGDIGGWTFSSTAGLSVPTGSMRLTQGYLFPTWEATERKPGWVLVPSFGVRASSSTNTRAPSLVTLHFETALGVPLGDREATPLETYAPIELLYAPALEGLRTRAGATWSVAFGDHVRARLLGEAAMLGRTTDVPRSPMVFHGSLIGEVGLGRRVRLEAGIHAYESDQRRTELIERDDGTVRRERIRSLDWFPAFDVIVTSP
jgi:hypothetical protein